MFERVQSILKGKTNTKGWLHDYLFRRLLTCATCGRSLIGEMQKGHVYYRCQTKTCPVTCIREESVDQSIRDALLPLTLIAEERMYLAEKIPSLLQDDRKVREARKLKLSSDEDKSIVRDISPPPKQR